MIGVCGVEHGLSFVYIFYFVSEISASEKRVTVLYFSTLEEECRGCVQ